MVASRNNQDYGEKTMSIRKVRKDAKMHGYYLWNKDLIRYIKLNSKLFEHTRFTHPKFPHYKWAKAIYLENKGEI